MIQLRRHCKSFLRALGSVAFLSLHLAAASAEGQTLSGSTRTMERQNRVAREHDFTFLKNADQVKRFVSRGFLVPLEGNADFRLHRVSFPYARPEVRTFVHRLAGQYRRACGERLVVTSLTRPMNRQPYNASHLSVHPTGMAVDLRRSRRSSCRRWLESTLLELEKIGVLDATRERRPAHYHVALFPKPYQHYVDRRLAAQAAKANEATVYTVRSGDSLWKIARRFGASVSALRTANGLTSNTIRPGQKVKVPGGGAGAAVQSYRVKKGDSLWLIARSFRTTVARLEALNGLASEVIYAGQRLLVPAPN